MSRRKRKNTLNAHEQYELLVGEMGVEHGTALKGMKLWQILSVIRGYRRRETGAWRRTRWQTWAVLCALGAKNLNAPSDLLELPGDHADADEISDEEYQASLDLIRQANAKMDDNNDNYKTYEKGILEKRMDDFLPDGLLGCYGGGDC